MAFGGSFKFERQQARDEYVRQYCKDNNIKLIEIRYDEDENGNMLDGRILLQ